MKDCLIITISMSMIKEHGYRNWLRNFLYAMSQEDWTYWMRQGSQPKVKRLLYVYLVIGGKIRFRTNFVMSEGTGWKQFSDGRKMYGKAWITLCGPVTRPIVPIQMKGFQGFRYTKELF